MRILLVTQMWPSPENPDLGSFLVPIRRELEASGHEVEVAAISRRGGPPTKYARLGARAVAAARRTHPDVVFAHFLFPAGAAGMLASMASRAPLVVMAHGQDVANVGRIRGAAAGTRAVLRRASAVIANSRWLADRLADRIPSVAGNLEVIDCGIDLDAFKPRPIVDARRQLGVDGGDPAFVCVGSLIERKNVVRLADAFARLGRGQLTFVGDGPQRGELEGRPNVRITGRVPQAEVPTWIAASHVLCQPSLSEPFGQATLEGMAMERSVVATRVGGPPEFVTPEAGVLVDPGATGELTEALARAASMGSPNAAAREAASRHDVVRQAARMADVLRRAVERGQ